MTPVGSTVGLATRLSLVSAPVAVVVTTVAHVPVVIPPVPIADVPLATKIGATVVYIGMAVGFPHRSIEGIEGETAQTVFAGTLRVAPAAALPK